MQSINWVGIRRNRMGVFTFLFICWLSQILRYLFENLYCFYCFCSTRTTAQRVSSLVGLEVITHHISNGLWWWLRICANTVCKTSLSINGSRNSPLNSTYRSVFPFNTLSPAKSGEWTHITLRWLLESYCFRRICLFIITEIQSELKFWRTMWCDTEHKVKRTT